MSKNGLKIVLERFLKMNRINVSDFIRINRIYLLDKNLSNTEKIFISLIDNLYNAKYDGCIANNSYFSEILNIKDRQIFKILKKLENDDYITITHLNNKRIIRIKITNFFDDL